MAARPSLAEARRLFAEELRVVAHVQDERVIDAFATVPRERFVGPGPWRHHRSDRAADEVLLNTGPQVRRDPVDEQARREVDDERDEDERESQEDDPLAAVPGLEVENWATE